MWKCVKMRKMRKCRKMCTHMETVVRTSRFATAWRRATPELRKREDAEAESLRDANHQHGPPTDGEPPPNKNRT